ncbi:MAG: glycosyltransferase family 39 protein [Planctomycetota bacterium]
MSDDPPPTDAATPDEPKTAASEPTRGWFAWAVAAATLFAAVWRAAWIEAPSLDHDEVYEVVHRTTDLGELVGRHDGFPPLYRWIASWAIELTGRDLTVRWFSWLAGVATVPIVAWLGRRVGGATAGVVAAAFLAVSANHVLVSQHGRGYALMTFFVAWLLLAAWRVRESGAWRDWASLGVAGWLGCATHYFAGIPLLLVGGMLLAEARGVRRGRAWIAAATLAAAGLPLAVCLQADLAESGEFFHRVTFDKEAYAFGYLWLVTGNTFGPSVTELRELTAAGDRAAAIAAMAPWAVAAAAPVGVLVVLGFRSLGPRDRRWLPLLLLAPPLLAAAAASGSPTGYNYRYLGWMVTPLCVWIGVGTACGRPRRLAIAAGVAAAVIGVTATVNRHLDTRYRENDFAAVAGLIESQSAESTPAVLLAPLYYGEGAAYSLPNDWPKRFVTAHPCAEQDWDTALPDFAARVGAGRVVWLVTQWFPPGHPQRTVCDKLADRIGAELVQRVSSTVMVYRTDSDRVR